MHRSLLTGLLAVSFIAACADPGASHKANVFKAGQVNQRQEVKTVNIIAVQLAKVEVSNQRNKDIAEGVGFLLGAVVGAAIGEGNNRGGQSAIIGGAVEADAGRLGANKTKLVMVSRLFTKKASASCNRRRSAAHTNTRPAPLW